jgi:ketosteroid isomerase-like protein
MASKLTVEQVKGEVLRFWNVFMEKNAEALMNFYAPDSSVFSSVSARVEPGRLAAARRDREYFHTKSTVRSTTGSVDVILVSDTAAVANYNFTFHATKVAGGMAGSNEEDIKQGRATQVFRLESDGRVLIVHEHLSSLDKS